MRGYPRVALTSLKPGMLTGLSFVVMQPPLAVRA